jgi:flagellar protein FlaG
MSSETIVTAIFLITAIVAAGVLASQVLPAVSSMSSTFSSSSHRVDEQLRTDIVIVNTFANRSRASQIWIKNTGEARIAQAELNKSIVFTGTPTNFETVTLNDNTRTGSTVGWKYEILESGNSDLDPGETLHITTYSTKNPNTAGDTVYFQFVLLNGVKRSEQFSVSNVV